eukprot:3169354-Pleurochrysis_carterae.AAC.7
MISQQLRMHMSVALSCVLSKVGRLMPPRSFDAVLVPLIEHLGTCARMGCPDCFGPLAAIGAAFFQLKSELRSSGSLYPAVEPITRYWLQIQYAIELHTFTLLMAALHSPETVRRVGDAIVPSPLSRQPSPSTHGPGHVDGGASRGAAFTLAMGDLRLDVGHEERSEKELPNLAYEHESSGLVPIIECFRNPDEAAAESSSSDTGGAPLAASSQVKADEPADGSSGSSQGDEDATGAAD